MIESEPAEFGDLAAPSVLLIADDPVAGDVAESTAAAMGMRLVGRVTFADAEARLARQAQVDLVLVETAGAGAALDRVLAQLADIGEDTALVVATDISGIDVVAGWLLGRAQLLCTPDHAERTAAIAAALGGERRRIHDSAQDDAERLRRLNAEVARIAEALARLTREHGAAPTPAVRERGTGYGAPPDAPPVTIEPSEVRGVIRARRMRDGFFPPGLFADPAWDMLLDLFAADLEHGRVSVSSLCIAAAVPGTTALRWIGTMLDAELFERQADRFDRRRAFISLTPAAREGMQRYFAAVHRAGLASA